MIKNLKNIKHIVVLMLENRGFDNMAGWIYADQQNVLNPNQVIPAGSSPKYDGLINQNNQGYDETKWCPGSDGKKYYATYGTTGGLLHNEYRVPPLDPHEEFNHMTAQFYGPGFLDKQPVKGAIAKMQGFAIDYATTFFDTGHPGDIMQCYLPTQANVTAQLARQYAISDAYFASCPTQTYPNRAFMAAGTSAGHVNNKTYNKAIPQAPTIFNVLYEAEQKNTSGEDYSWGVYFSDYSITDLKMGAIKKIPKKDRDQHFHLMETFYDDCDSGCLPAYSFLEPHYLPLPHINCNHPPFHINYGEELVCEVYNKLSSSKCWKDTLLIINYDEHGGCYDHVSPPWGVSSPDKESNPSMDPDAQKFDFTRLGARVPMLMISPWIDTGIVFRGQDSGPPLDHTSILATVLDWKSLSRDTLSSARVQAAQNLDYVLNDHGTTPNLVLQPAATSNTKIELADDVQLTSLQRGIIYSLAEEKKGVQFADKCFQEVKSIGDLKNFLANL